jgi:hypothetical protein
MKLVSVFVLLQVLTSFSGTLVIVIMHLELDRRQRNTQHYFLDSNIWSISVLALSECLKTDEVARIQTVSLDSRSARIGILSPTSKKKKAVSVIDLSAYYKRPRYCPFLETRDPRSRLARFSHCSCRSSTGKAMK